MGTLAVGSADGPQPVKQSNPPPWPHLAYIYDLSRNAFVTNIVFLDPEQLSMASGEWTDQLHHLRRVHPWLSIT
jgi:hypothetical protein